ncbi:MAG TPA: sulfide/dihydroorotate dehydrogenase-like FAD/NAD-binding protein [bacterium]
MIRGQKFKIIKKRMLNPQTGIFVISAPYIAKKHNPGHFIILRVNETGERIPLTIADSDPEQGTITIVVQGIGKTTTMLNSLQAGEDILDIVGPLGNSTHIENYGTVLIIGGGVGTAEAYPIAKGMKAAGNKVIGIIGARTQDLVIFEEEMANVCDEIFITTDDGSYGHKGFVSDILKDMIQKKTKIDLVVAVGPVPMMKVVCGITKEVNIHTLVSLNPIMMDGTGMCGGCRVTVGSEGKFVCVDGPEFDGHKVDFDLLVKRQRMYVNEEKRSLNVFKEHKCKVSP